VIGESAFRVSGAISFSGLARISRNSADYRWRDDVWTMKYLSGFKWEMLGEQVGMFSPPLPIIRYPVSSVP